MLLQLFISVCTAPLPGSSLSLLNYFGDPPSQSQRQQSRAQRLSVSPALATYQWPVTLPVKGLVFISHGYAEHLRPYYDRVGRYLKTFFNL